MTIEDWVAKVKVIGKREERSLIFGRPKYVVAFQIVDEKILRGDKTFERRCPFHQYCSMNIGDVIGVHLYSSNQKNWFFSKEKVELD